jgi:hypothetical protein
VQWDLVISDPDPRVSPKTIANTILSKAHPGAIVVAHCQCAGAKAAALAIALPKLKEQGYGFVTVSELLKAGKPVIAARCYQNNPGDMTPVARTSARRGNYDLFPIFSRPRACGGRARAPPAAQAWVLFGPCRRHRGHGAVVGDELPR